MDPILDSDDLLDIESDLSLAEKVSVLFLLCQDDLEAQFFLQQLQLLISMPENTHSTMILDWSRGNPGYSQILVESLCVAQCNHILVKLGINLEHAELFHYPNRPEIVTHIHPIVKLLFLAIQQLSVLESEQFLDNMKQKFPSQLAALEINCPNMLEVHFLHWISLKLITVFGQDLKLDPFVKFLKENDHLDVYDFVQSNMERYKTRSTHLARDRDTGPLQEEPTTKIHLPIAAASTSSPSYSINRDSPGVLLIIHQFKFHAETDPDLAYLLPSKPLDCRKGSEKDVEALKRVFSRFRYKIILKEDLTHHDIIAVIKSVCGTLTKTDSSLFIAILSHGCAGSSGCVYGSNSIPLEVREIKNHLFQSAGHLLGKPKCLIIQACQGQDLQISQALDTNLQTDSPNTRPNQLVTIPPYSDLLTAWSTVEGFASLRHIVNGTWFVQTLCELIEEHWRTTHLVDILTLVNNRIASMKGPRNESMIPKIESTLRKQFFFPKDVE